MDIEDDFSDSDDDLLGINDDPVNLKIIRRSPTTNKINNNPKNNIYSTPRHIERFKIPSYSTPILSSRRETFSRISNKLGRVSNVNISSHNEELGIELLNLSHIQNNSQKTYNKYQRFCEIREISGFVVNVHDATNFDIDLQLTPKLHEKYQSVISNQYTYKDIPESHILYPADSVLSNSTTVGTTYRCRLRGIGTNHDADNYGLKSNMVCHSIKQIIDRTDGWVICTLSDIDVYSRLLVDIIVCSTTGPINLYNYLMEYFDSRESIFYAYVGK